MRALYLPPLLILALASSPSFAQDNSNDVVTDDVSAKQANTTEQDKDSAQEPGESPPLREEYQPSEEISKDKAEAFPADI